MSLGPVGCCYLCSSSNLTLHRRRPLGFDLLLLMVSFNSSPGYFQHAIGVQDPSIVPDNQMTASSYFSSSYYPHFGRLHDIRGGGWAGRTSRNPSDWLQVDFGRIALVCAVATQGDTKGNEWVIDFSLSFSSDGASWMYSSDSQGNKMASLYLNLGFNFETRLITLPFLFLFMWQLFAFKAYSNSRLLST